jgi:hypothetical protein
MIRNETIVKDDYTIHVTLNDGRCEPATAIEDK